MCYKIVANELKVIRNWSACLVILYFPRVLGDSINISPANCCHKSPNPKIATIIIIIWENWWDMTSKIFSCQKWLTADCLPAGQLSGASHRLISKIEHYKCLAKANTNFAKLRMFFLAAIQLSKTCCLRSP